MSSNPPADPSKEVALTERVLAGDDVLLDVRRLLAPKLEALLDEHAGGVMERIDLEQEAHLALAIAVRDYPWGERAGFEDAALSHVARHLAAAVAHAKRPLLIPSAFADMAERLLEATKSLIEELGREPTRGEVRERIGCTEEEMKTALSMRATKGEFVAPPFQIDAPVRKP